MQAHPLKTNLTYALLLILGLSVLSSCAQNSRNIPESSCGCIDIPCVPCLFPIPLKLSHTNCKAAQDTSIPKS